MKKSLIIKLNDIVIDISANYDKAVKKSLEFFMGSMLDEKVIAEFRKRKCPANNHQCIQSFLEEKNIFLRDKAIIKKFHEFYAGKEFTGFISDSRVLINNKKLDALSQKYNLLLLCLMPKEEADFLIQRNKLDKFNVVCSESLKDGLRAAKEKLKPEYVYLGNSILDYNAAVEAGMSFFGHNMTQSEIPKGKTINKIEEI